MTLSTMLELVKKILGSPAFLKKFIFDKMLMANYFV